MKRFLKQSFEESTFFYAQLRLTATGFRYIISIWRTLAQARPEDILGAATSLRPTEIYLNAYGLKDIRTKRRNTSESWIGAVFFVMNLVSLVKIADLHAIFYALFNKVFRYGTYPGGMRGLLRGVFAPIGNVCRNTRRIAVA